MPIVSAHFRSVFTFEVRPHPVDDSFNAGVDARLVSHGAHSPKTDDAHQFPASSAGEALQRAATVAVAGVSPAGGVPSAQHH